ncbi:MAG: PQQ-binding-like beta-propeller repeat protein [Rhodothermales bacterium]
MRFPLFTFIALFVAACIISACGQPRSGPGYAEDRFTTWTRYEGEPGATSFSRLDQIDRSNVDRLEVAWTHRLSNASAINPIASDTFLYVLGDDNSVLALHAATGREIWTYSSGERVGVAGLMYWENDDRSDRRVFVPAGRTNMVALDATSGEPIREFGDGGTLDLRPGLGIDPELVARATSPTPGVIFDDLLVLGSATGEGYFASPGHIRAFDVRTGEQEWIFHTLPQPGEVGYETWPPGRSDNTNVRGETAFGGANAWGGMSVDYERGIVYVPLGSANYDFYGVDRHGENLFANSLVALDAYTGERLWHFQTVHHDLWDYDLTATPVLLTVEHDGETVDVVALATKLGMVFVFDRETGAPLWPIEERPVPESDMPGEQAWPTQPFATIPEPFVPQSFDLEEDLNPHLDPSERDSLVAFVRGMRFEGMFTPPSTQPTLQIPGNRGGANWGSTAGDPRDGTFVVLSYNMPSVLQLHPITAGAEGTGGSPIDQGRGIYESGCALCHGADLGGQPAGGIPSLVDVTERMTPEEFQEIVQIGAGKMPGFPQLDEGDLTSLRMYLANPELAVTSLADDEGTADVEVPENVRYQSGWIHVLDSKGVPVIRPPWFRLTAYDLNDGSIKWQVPVGEVPHLAEQGVRNTGSAFWLRGGPAITAGGLIFQAVDDGLAAFDLDTGEEIWSYELPGLVGGIPAVYEVDGRQYVVVSVTGGYQGQSPTEAPEPGYVAFALPHAP